MCQNESGTGIFHGCPINHQYLQRNDVLLHYIEAGDPDSPLVLLLHGFPSFWYAWKFQIRTLSGAGYRVVALDLRGYNYSGKPEQVVDYSREQLTADVLEFVEKLNKGQPAILVGHDWGGAVAWAFAQDYPHKVQRLAVLNMPHPLAFSEALFSNPHQMRRSWYIFLFQVPQLGERFLGHNGFETLVRIWTEGLAREQPAEHTERHIAAYSIPGALSGGINYYKAMLRGLWTKPDSSEHKVTIPVLYIWGEKEEYFTPDLADPPQNLVPSCTVVKIPTASHWVMWDEPEIVNSQLLAFFGERQGGTSHRAAGSGPAGTQNCTSSGGKMTSEWKSSRSALNAMKSRL